MDVGETNYSPTTVTAKKAVTLPPIVRSYHQIFDID